MTSGAENFEGESGFCTCCGCILPMLGDSGLIKCFMCQTEYSPLVFGEMENHYELHFHSPSEFQSYDVDLESQDKSEVSNSGPIVERKCPKCGNDTMSYATLQLRSADEGQTVFYTCTKCSYKETENS